MSEKIYVRKCERYTVWEASDPIEVDVEKLTKCVPPYEGSTEEHLLEYLTNNVCDNEEWADTNKEIYGDDESYELTLMDSWDSMEPYSDSRGKFCDDWMDVGVPNESFTKTGYFEIKSTNVD